MSVRSTGKYYHAPCRYWLIYRGFTSGTGSAVALKLCEIPFNDTKTLLIAAPDRLSGNRASSELNVSRLKFPLY